MSRVFVAHTLGEKSWETFSGRNDAFQAPGRVGGGKGSKGVQRSWVLPEHEHALDEATGSGGGWYNEALGGGGGRCQV